MQKALRTELLAIMQAVAFPAGDTVTFAGRSSPTMAGPASGLSPIGHPVVTQLQNLFYEPIAAVLRARRRLRPRHRKIGD